MNPQEGNGKDIRITGLAEIGTASVVAVRQNRLIGVRIVLVSGSLYDLPIVQKVCCYFFKSLHKFGCFIAFTSHLLWLKELCSRKPFHIVWFN